MVEAHGAAVHIAGLNLHAVQMQPLHEEPGEGAEEEVVQEDGNCSAQQLKTGQGCQDLSCLARLRPPQASAPHL